MLLVGLLGGLVELWISLLFYRHGRRRGPDGQGCRRGLLEKRSPAVWAGIGVL